MRAYILIIMSITLVSCNKLDYFAQCLTDQGLVMYGSAACTHCNDQKDMFKDSFKLINYTDCGLLPDKCKQLNITGYPTWIADDVQYAGVQTISTLKLISGCQ